jgi:hypothetical protein
MLRVVRGNPTPQELAALIAVVTSRAASADVPARPRSRWASPVLRGPLFTGPGAWRAPTLTR